MGKGSDRQVSASRRGFFRDLLVSGIETLEKTGKAMADRAGYRNEPAYEPSQTPDYASDPYWNSWDQYGSTYGPPWPPRYGPEIPQAVREQLKQD